MTTSPWIARVSRSERRWHRVERLGAHISADPVALVREPAHAVAMAALPDLAEALSKFRSLHAAECGCAACHDADAALAKMEGRDDATP